MALASEFGQRVVLPARRADDVLGIASSAPSRWARASPSARDGGHRLFSGARRPSEKGEVTIG